MKWTPVVTVALAAHTASLAPFFWENKGRFATQDGVMRWTWIKAGVTAAGAAVNLYSGLMGKKVNELAHEGARGATEPSPDASSELQQAQKRLRLLQWANPVLAGTVIVLGAKHGEMQRPQNLKPKSVKNLKRLKNLMPGL